MEEQSRNSGNGRLANSQRGVRRERAPQSGNSTGGSAGNAAGNSSRQSQGAVAPSGRPNQRPNPSRDRRPARAGNVGQQRQRPPEARGDRQVQHRRPPQGRRPTPQPQASASGEANLEMMRRNPSYEDLMARMEKLRGIYLELRKRYFDCFGKMGDRERARLMGELQVALKNLRQFEQSCRTEFQALFEKREITYMMDTIYTSTLETEGSDPFDHPDLHNLRYEDPHHNEIQRERTSFASDQEESEGTMDDYYLYRAQKPTK